MNWNTETLTNEHLKKLLDKRSLYQQKICSLDNKIIKKTIDIIKHLHGLRKGDQKGNSYEVTIHYREDCYKIHKSDCNISEYESNNESSLVSFLLKKCIELSIQKLMVFEFYVDSIEKMSQSTPNFIIIIDNLRTDNQKVFRYRV